MHGDKFTKALKLSIKLLPGLLDVLIFPQINISKWRHGHNLHLEADMMKVLIFLQNTAELVSKLKVVATFYNVSLPLMQYCPQDRFSLSIL